MNIESGYLIMSKCCDMAIQTFELSQKEAGKPDWF